MPCLLYIVVFKLKLIKTKYLAYNSGSDRGSARSDCNINHIIIIQRVCGIEKRWQFLCLDLIVYKYSNRYTLVWYLDFR